MDVDFAFVCDAAQDSGGKLHALGIGIDRLYAPEVPTTHPMLVVVVQVRYSVVEAGTKPLAIRVVDADGGDLIPPIDQEIQFPDPRGSPTGTARLVLQLGGLRFERFGDYAIHIAISGTDIASLPLAVSSPAASA